MHKPGSVSVKETRPCAVTQIDTCKGKTRPCDMQHGRDELGFFEPNNIINRVFRFLFSLID